MENLINQKEDSCISLVFNNSEFDYQFLVKKIDLMEACGENGTLVTFEVSKTPKFTSIEKLNDIKKCFGFESIEEIVTEDICEYGLCVPIESKTCYSEKEIEDTINAFSEQIPTINMMFSFYMDKPVNRIGNNGWDLLDGNIGLK